MHTLLHGGDLHGAGNLSNLASEALSEDSGGPFEVGLSTQEKAMVAFRCSVKPRHDASPAHNKVPKGLKGAGP
jgi:hypothetical protein